MNKATTAAERHQAEATLRAMAAELGATILDLTIHTQENGMAVLWTFSETEELDDLTEAETLDDCFLLARASLTAEEETPS